MAYDEELADRVRALLGGQVVDERRMFGGLGLLVGGHMGLAVTDDGLMVRVDPAHTAHLLEQPGVAEVVMGARAPMTGWVQARGEALVDDAALASWVRRGLERAQALPPER